MTRHRLYYHDAKEVRESLNRAIDIAKTIRDSEFDLIEMLREIDQKRFYLRYGYRSLTGFCRRALRFSRLRTQSVVIQVRSIEGLEKRFADDTDDVDVSDEDLASEELESQTAEKNVPILDSVDFWPS